MCVSVRLYALYCFDCLTFDLDFFGMRVNLDLGEPGIVGQGRSSKVKVKPCVCLRSPV